MCVCTQSLNCNQLLATPWTRVHQAPLSREFSRQEYWSGLPFPTPDDLPYSRDWTHISCICCSGRWILYHCATWEAQVFIYDTSIKEQIDELNFTEIKNFCSMKDTLRRMRKKKKRLHPHWWINSSLLSLIYMSLFEQVPKDYQTRLLRWRWKNAAAAAAAKPLQSRPTLCDPIDGSPPGSRPWDSPGKNTGVGCHFLLQCIKVKSESEVAQSCPTLSDPTDCSPPASSIHGIFQVEEWCTANML